MTVNTRTELRLYKRNRRTLWRPRPQERQPMVDSRKQALPIRGRSLN
jgi:hypothetical protein